MQSVSHISTRQELIEFVKLWSLLKNVQLREEVQDNIPCKWEPSGDYSAASAYKIQFQGSHPSFHLGQLWKTKATPKVRLFGWTTMHHKILTAKNLAARGMKHNQTCSLCNTSPENAQHLLTDYNFTKSVLRYIWAWFQLGGCLPLTTQPQGNADWLAFNSAKAVALHR
jgi:hypothetical protein